MLVFRGTGFNIWHYWPLLKTFSFEELSQFRAVYAVSGASLLLWLYCLVEQHAISPHAAKAYDKAMRGGLNQRGLLERTALALAGKAPYAAADFLRVFRELAPPPACDQTFGELGLKTLTIAAHEETRRELLLFNAQNFPSARVGEIVSRAVTWSEMSGRPFCQRTPYKGMMIGDFDFGGPDVPEQFRAHLRTTHPGAAVYHVNLFQNRTRETDRFVRVCFDRHPRIWQLIDFALFYLGLPNVRYERTAARDASDS